MCLAALVAWLRGHPDRAAAVIEQALTRAKEVNHPYTLAWTLNFAAVIHQIRGEVDATLRMAEQCIRHSTQHEFPFWLAGGRVMAGWAQLAAGNDVEAALAEARDGLASWRATGAVVFSPYYLACLTDCYRRLGRSAQGFDALSEMIGSVQETGERWWEPELHRLKGELLLDRGSVSEQPSAERCFRHAFELAQSQNSRSLALRTAMSVAKLYKQRGQGADAHRLMAEAYGKFDQGFETADLREAMALMAALR
jgi:predicted ATPase